jgi:hypothetical protein
MSDWLTYAPQDFLLFSPRVYYRLIELHNEALWPLQVAALALGLLVLFAALRGSPAASRVVFALLGALWMWIAWSYLWQRYASINWAVAYAAPLFAAQGLALIWCGGIRKKLRLAPLTGLVSAATAVLLATAVIAYPLIAPLMGRPWTAAETFGIFPEPTALATVAVLAGVPSGGALLMIIPLLWCVLASEILWLLGSPDFFIPAIAALAAVLLRIMRRLGETSA